MPKVAGPYLPVSTSQCTNLPLRVAVHGCGIRPVPCLARCGPPGRGRAATNVILLQSELCSGGGSKGGRFAELRLRFTILSAQATPDPHITSAIITSIRTEISAGGQNSWFDRFSSHPTSALLDFSFKYSFARSFCASLSNDPDLKKRRAGEQDRAPRVGPPHVEKLLCPHTDHAPAVLDLRWRRKSDRCPRRRSFERYLREPQGEHSEAESRRHSSSAASVQPAKVGHRPAHRDRWQESGSMCAGQSFHQADRAAVQTKPGSPQSCGFSFDLHGARQRQPAFEPCPDGNTQQFANGPTVRLRPAAFGAHLHLERPETVFPRNGCASQVHCCTDRVFVRTEKGGVGVEARGVARLPGHLRAAVDRDGLVYRRPAVLVRRFSGGYRRVYLLHVPAEPGERVQRSRRPGRSPLERVFPVHLVSYIWPNQQETNWLGN
ncbi:hypothetical protein KL932_001188 [Ogataea haglerorum]|nr:hypothetical protein KL932_001188 [Ogataea haglerorum]